MYYVLNDENIFDLGEFDVVNRVIKKCLINFVII